MADRTGDFYPAEGAIHGYGAELQVSDGSSPPNWESIATINSITPGDMTTEDIPRTHLRSPDAHEEHMAGMRNSGPFELEGIWLPNEQSQNNAGGGSGAFASGGLIALWRGRQNHDFRILVPDGSSPGLEWPFRGYVSKFQPGAITTADKINFSAAIQPTEAYDANLP